MHVKVVWIEIQRGKIIVKFSLLEKFKKLEIALNCVMVFLINDIFKLRETTFKIVIEILLRFVTVVLYFSSYTDQVT